MVGMTIEEDDGQAGMTGHDPFVIRPPVTQGEGDVKEEEIDRRPIHGRQGLGPATDHHHLVAVCFQHGAQRFPDSSVLFHDKYRLHRHPV